MVGRMHSDGLDTTCWKLRYVANAKTHFGQKLQSLFHAIPIFSLGTIPF